MSSNANRAQTVGLKIYSQLPPLFRQRLVRSVKPSFTVGVMAVVVRPDGALLLVRHSYLSNWSFPGGLVNRRERIEVGVARETREEVGLRIALVGEPAVVVDPYRQVVRVVYRAVPAEGASADDAHPASPEIIEVGWFQPGAIATMSPEAAEALRSLERSERGNR